MCILKNNEFGNAPWSLLHVAQYIQLGSLFVLLNTNALCILATTQDLT